MSARSPAQAGVRVRRRARARRICLWNPCRAPRDRRGGPQALPPSERGCARRVATETRRCAGEHREGRRRGDVDGERLLPTRHREVYLGQQLRVEQRSVERAVGIVDAEALAQRVQVVALAGERVAGESEGIDDPPVRVRAARQPGEAQLGIEEREVERARCGSPTRRRARSPGTRDDVAELGLPLSVVPRHAVHLGRTGVDVALGIEVEVQRAARGAAVHDFDRGDLDDSVALLRIEARGLGVEDDLAHAGSRQRRREHSTRGARR